MDTLKKILHVIKVIYGVVFAIAGLMLIFVPKDPSSDTATIVFGVIFCFGVAALLLKPGKKETPPAKPVQPTPEPVTSPISNNISSAQGYEAGEQCVVCKTDDMQVDNSVYNPSSKPEDIEHLEKEIALLREQLSPGQNKLVDIRQDIEKSKAEKHKLDDKIKKQRKCLKEIKNEIVETEDVALMQSFGLYTPRYDFMRADEYRSRLLEIRAQQKEAIRDGTAVRGSTAWAIDGSIKKGSKMVADMQKLLLRAFNAECDDIVEHVRYNNIEASEKRITASTDAISKLGQMMDIGITSYYYRLKVDELHLAFEWQQKKQQEKEEQREARAELKEAQRLARELEEERRKLEKEQTHYQNALVKINAQLLQATGDEAAAIEEKKAHIEQQLDKIDTAFKEVDYREANQRAGYVYIISNIGAFGENVYKIGMTRRLDPSDRVDELGDASVPFKFDIHAMIFSDDAPKLEAALHNAFADRKLNFVNQRREFFNVTLDEIKKVVKENFDKSVEFTDTPPAEQYRESLLLRAQANANT